MMQVSLVHAEVQAAVVALLAKRGVVVEGHDIAVTFSMGRKGTGLTATVSIDDPDVKVLPDAPAPEVVLDAAESSPVEAATPVAPSIPASEEAPLVDPEPPKETAALVNADASVTNTTEVQPSAQPKSLFDAT